MAKKYKHIPTGNIASETHSGINYRVTIPKNFTVPKWIVENSNDWEEIKEEKKPEWTILSFKKESLWTLTPNGEYVAGTYSTSKVPFSMEILLRNNFPIHSVRRESDGEVFTVGDKTNGGTILEIHKCGLEVCGEKKPDFLHIVYAHDLVGSIYPDFKDVQKVKPKEWEITAFRTLNNMAYSNKGDIAYKRNHNGDFETYYLERKANFEIYSVKRLSDGVEFKIGDKTPYKNADTSEQGIIYRFLFPDVLKGKIASEIYKQGGWIQLESFKKAEKLFTTEDGVDIYEGDKYWCAHDDKHGIRGMQWTVNSVPYIATSNITYDYRTLEGKIAQNKSGNYYFGSKEAAEEYILMNKPCLSVSEVLGEFTENYGAFKNGIKELAKSKLNK